jgi:hypothetical protein
MQGWLVAQVDLTFFLTLKLGGLLGGSDWNEPHCSRRQEPVGLPHPFVFVVHSQKGSQCMFYGCYICFGYDNRSMNDPWMWWKNWNMQNTVLSSEFFIYNMKKTLMHECCATWSVKREVVKGGWQGQNQCFFLCFKFVARVARGCDKSKPFWLFAKKISVM